MQVQWAIHCRYAEVNGLGATIVGAGADVLILPEIPTTEQLVFAVKYTASPEELAGGTDHTLTCRTFDPGAKLLGEVTEEGKFEGEMIVEGYVAEMIVPTTVVLEVEQYGSYRFEFSIDGNAHNVPIHIVNPEIVSEQ